MKDDENYEIITVKITKDPCGWRLCYIVFSWLTSWRSECAKVATLSTITAVSFFPNAGSTSSLFFGPTTAFSTNVLNSG